MREECGHAWDAYQHLVADPESSYGRFVAMHKQFLQRNRAAIEVDERRLQLPRRALEEEGLECAVWPHLYPKTAWRETQVVAATVPADNLVQESLVEGSQRSWTGSGWPKEPKTSYYDGDTGVLHLQHKEEDWCKHNRAGVPEGIRAYMPDLLNSLHCHIDVQASDGRGMLLKYVSGYVPKFSDSFTTDWLSDQCSDYAIAKRVLTDYHPLEPEMTLQLAMQWFPQCFAGGTLQRFRVPVPWEGTCAERVVQYMRSRWRAEDMCLEEFLRKTNKKGQIHNYIKKAYEKATRRGAEGDEEVLEESLEAWANNVQPQGQVMVAAVYLSRYNDKYYGQRVLMTHPFRKMEELARPELDLAPPHLYYQTLAFLVQKEHWTNEAAIRADLELEAFREHHIRNIVAMLFANQSLIEKCIDGSLDKNDDVPEAEWQQDGQPGEEQAPQLSQQQQNIVQELGASRHETTGWSRGCMEGRRPGRDRDGRGSACISIAMARRDGVCLCSARPRRQWQDHSRASGHSGSSEQWCPRATHSTHWEAGCYHAGKVSGIGSGHRPWSLPRLQASAGNVGAHVAL